MKKFLIITICLIFAIILGTTIGCESTPEEADTEPTATADMSVTTDTGLESEIESAKQAILRAEEADAALHAPELLQQAKDKLASGEEKASADTKAAREDLDAAVEKANEAYDISFQSIKADYTEKLEKLDEKLISIESDKYYPDKYGEFSQQREEALQAFESNDLADAKIEAEEALSKGQSISSTLEEKTRWVNILKRDAENMISDADNEQTNEWAPEKLEEARDHYSEAEESLANYNIEEAEDLYNAAKVTARNAMALAAERKKIAQTEQIMLEVMEELEEASEMTVVTEDGEVIEPEPWEGDDYIKNQENEEEGVETDEKGNEETGESGDNGSSSSIIMDNAVEVLADVSRDSLLDEAKRLWQLGVEEREKGNYELAQEYFAESKRYVASYKAMAVGSTYKVQYIPDRRDCLWRIAEREDIYGNPYMWPKIWTRNKKLIYHPDLIMVGWVLVIPPE